MSSGEDGLHNLPKVVGEAEVAAVLAVGQFLVIEAQRVENTGVQVMDMHWVFNSLPAEFVGAAIDRAALDAASGQPGRERLVVVIAAGVGGAILVARRLAAGLATPAHQRTV